MDYGREERGGERGFRVMGYGGGAGGVVAKSREGWILEFF